MINILSIIVVILIIYIYKNSIENGQFSCNNYIINIYSYVLLALILTFLISLIVINRNNLLKKYITLMNNSYVFWILFLIMIVLIYVFHLDSVRYNLYKSHIVWLLLIICLSITLINAINIFNKNNILYNTICTTILAVIITKTLVYFNQDFFKKYFTDNIFAIVMFAFSVSILSNIILLLLYNFNKISINTFLSFDKILSYIFVTIFITLLVYDTKKLLNFNKDNCKKALLYCNKSQNDMSKTLGINNIKCFENYPNYPLQSFNIYLNIINLFLELGNLKNR